MKLGLKKTKLHFSEVILKSKAYFVEAEFNSSHPLMPHQIQIPLVIAWISDIIRYCNGVPYDGGTNIRRVETNNAHLGPPTKRRKVQEFLCFKSENVNTMIKWLRDDSVTTIGINGMGGVGKTALAIELYNWVLQHDMSVAWVSVGEKVSVYQLQEKISKAFELDLEGDKDEIRRSGRINALLTRNKKCVLFLDDLWSDFRLEDVGIPWKCKVVLVSRSSDVCRILRCEKVLKVEPLIEKESWELFQHSIGCGVSDIEKVHWIRELVWTKCGGLPLAIIELANSLKKRVNDSGSSWMEALESLGAVSVGGIHLEKSFRQLKRSYDMLKDVERIQRCFLYCAVYPKGSDISKKELIWLWIGEKLIGDMESLQAQYDMGYSILNKLVKSSLLETRQDERMVRMHDLVRDMALSIAKDYFMVQAGVPSKLEFYKDIHVVSCIKSSISLIQLNNKHKCINLSTLLLQHNPLKTIPDQIFLDLCSLRVLNLSDTRITRLPTSIAALEELRVLDLSFCENLKQVPSLAKLLKLQFLDLSQTAITKVADSLNKMKMLRELNLSSLPEPTKIPSEVLASLFRLKKLVCHFEGVIQELQRMKSLEILEVKFSSLCDLNNYVQSQHWCILESYYLQVGGELGFELPYNRRVSLQGCSLTTQCDNIMLPGNVQEFFVDDCKGIFNLSDVVHFVAHNNKNDENFASVGSFNEEQKFNNQVVHFSSLEICSISRCHEVETLFAPYWIKNLQSLELLQVDDCKQLEKILIDENVECGYTEGNRAVISLPQLRQLALTKLPRMNSIYKGRLVCASLLSCTFLDCLKLNRLPFFWMDSREKSFPSRLEWIEGNKKWWEMLEWDQPESKALLETSFTCRSLDGN